MTDTFSEHDRAIMRRIPRKWPRRSTLSVEQVIELRRRIDSLTTPWTLRDLAYEYGISVRQVIKIARRKDWDDPAFEPDQKEWWWRSRFQR